MVRSHLQVPPPCGTGGSSGTQALCRARHHDPPSQPHGAVPPPHLTPVPLGRWGPPGMRGGSGGALRPCPHPRPLPSGCDPSPRWVSGPGVCPPPQQHPAVPGQMCTARCAGPDAPPPYGSGNPHTASGLHGQDKLPVPARGSPGPRPPPPSSPHPMGTVPPRADHPRPLWPWRPPGTPARCRARGSRLCPCSCPYPMTRPYWGPPRPPPSRSVPGAGRVPPGAAAAPRPYPRARSRPDARPHWFREPDKCPINMLIKLLRS